MATSAVQHPKVVSQAEWLAARKILLAREKELTHRRDALAAERRLLPWVRVEKNYLFDAPGGKKTLAELFDGRSQLAIYHFMFGPEWKEGCPSCSMAADGFDSVAVHLAQRDVTLAAVSRATLPQIEAFKNRMGWRFPWVSSNGTSFNSDFRVSFTREELAAGNCYNFATSGFPADEAPGLSIFHKDAAGNVFHTYSTYGRGLEELLGAYFLLDRVPKGRDEDALPGPMAWVRHHDRYETRPVERQQSAPKADSGCCSAGGHQ
ncbi:MAG TPA: DUF899 domain-containing protein [Candidatus Acidoferrum sp.]